jgi:hypothetical protein
MSGFFKTVIYVDEDFTLCKTCAMGAMIKPVTPAKAHWKEGCWCHGSIVKKDPCKEHIPRDKVVHMSVHLEEVEKS